MIYTIWRPRPGTRGYRESWTDLNEAKRAFVARLRNETFGADEGSSMEVYETSMDRGNGAPCSTLRVQSCGEHDPSAPRQAGSRRRFYDSSTPEWVRQAEVYMQPRYQTDGSPFNAFTSDVDLNQPWTGEEA